jgi:peptidoglycan hydrolase-like protein with peptidoglycan-binding domain
MKKYFEILELDVSASIEEVEQAYKELTEAWRPENYQNLPRFKRKAEIKLEEVNDAYERIRSYLLAKASGEDQMVFDSPTDPSSGSEQQMQPAERTEPPKVSTSSPKKILMMGLVAVAAVLGTLMLYLYSNRQKTLPPEPQTIVAEKENAAQNSKSASPPVATDRLKKESKSNSAGKFSTEKQSPLVKTTTQKTLLQNQPDFDDLLTQEALSRYNRNPIQVKRIQNGLITIGYNPGPIDGVIGPLTINALKQFARDRSHIFADGDFFASDLTRGVLVFGEVSAKHPDWDHMISSEDFRHWLDNQKVMSVSQIKKLKKSATARQIIEMLDSYKSDKKTP